MLRQIEWRVQNGPITKNGVLPVTTLLFWKFCFSFRTSYKELILCTNHLNVHIIFEGVSFPCEYLKRKDPHIVQHNFTTRNSELRFDANANLIKNGQILANLNLMKLVFQNFQQALKTAIIIIRDKWIFYMRHFITSTRHCLKSVFISVFHFSISRQCKKVLASRKGNTSKSKEYNWIQE